MARQIGRLDPLPAGPELPQAVAWVKDLVRFVGPGFHPDTPFEDYITHDGVPSFTPRQCILLKTGLQRAWGVLDAAQKDLYAVTFRVQRLLLRK